MALSLTLRLWRKTWQRLKANALLLGGFWLAMVASYVLTLIFIYGAFLIVIIDTHLMLASLVAAKRKK
jgi:hypothetical protein